MSSHSQKLPFQLVYNREHPNLKSFHQFLQDYIEKQNLAQCHDAYSVMKKAYSLYSDLNASDEVVEIHLAWMKTQCMTIIKDIKQTENRKYFDHTVQSLFYGNNPEAITFCSSITRLLRQFRLSGTYDAKDIISEAYARGIDKIEEGTTIKIPLAWLRRTCLNVIREFKKKQAKADKPKLDGDACSLGGEAMEQLLLDEDMKAIRVAFERLSLEDQNILHVRIFQGLSWREVSKQLERSDTTPVSIGTARQRGSRALIRLRQHYVQIRKDIRLLPQGDL